MCIVTYNHLDFIGGGKSFYHPVFIRKGSAGDDKQDRNNLVFQLKRLTDFHT